MSFFRRLLTDFLSVPNSTKSESPPQARVEPHLGPPPIPNHVSRARLAGREPPGPQARVITEQRPEITLNPREVLGVSERTANTSLSAINSDTVADIFEDSRPSSPDPLMDATTAALASAVSLSAQLSDLRELTPLDALSAGIKFTKLKKVASKSKLVIIRFDVIRGQIRWKSKSKPRELTTINVDSIVEIRDIPSFLSSSLSANSSPLSVTAIAHSQAGGSYQDNYNGAGSGNSRASSVTNSDVGLDSEKNYSSQKSSPSENTASLPENALQNEAKCDTMEKTAELLTADRTMQVSVEHSSQSIPCVKAVVEQFPPSKILSIHYRGHDSRLKVLDLLCPTLGVRKTWAAIIDELRSRVSQLDGKDFIKFVHATWTHRAWVAADRDEDGRAYPDEISRVLKQFNVSLSRTKLQALMNSFDCTKKGFLNFSEFNNLCKSLRSRSDIRDLVTTLTYNNEDTLKDSDSSISRGRLGFLDFKRFLHEEQHENSISDDQALAIFKRYSVKTSKYGSSSDDIESRVLDIKSFHIYLLSQQNTPFKPTASPQVLDRPLSHYFIQSSHNTYLLGNQLKGQSSVEGYIRALQLGCRCVELDCWDGPNEEPVIYHGHTLTTKILFRDVVAAIKRYAFVASAYPIILSLEMHCSLPFQSHIVRYLKSILGDALVTQRLAENETCLPSPEALKYRFLVKTKFHFSESGNTFGTNFSSGSIFQPHEFSLESKALSSRLIAHSRYPSLSSIPPGECCPTAQPQSSASSTSAPASPSSTPQQLEASGGSQPTELQTLAVYLCASKFISLDDCWRQKRLSEISGIGANDYFRGISSLSETRAARHFRSNMNGFQEYHRERLTRVYPGLSRLNSANYNPFFYWAAGAQLVSLNWQTYDKWMDLNSGLFANSGGSGYVLKPAFMLDSSISPVQPCKVSIKIISGQQLPKPRGKAKGQVIDPRVCLEVYYSSAQNNASKRLLDNSNSNASLDFLTDTLMGPELATENLGLCQEMTSESALLSASPEDRSKGCTAISKNNKTDTPTTLSIRTSALDRGSENSPSGRQIGEKIVIGTEGSQAELLRTRTVRENGWNPVWNEKFKFTTPVKSFTMLRFVVYDGETSNSTNSVVGSWSAMLSDIKQGYRHLNLRSWKGTQSDNSTLFVHFKFEDE